MEREVAARELSIGIAAAAENEAATVSDFESLLRDHERKVLGTALRLLGNPQDAEDAAQEVFLRLHRYERSLDRSRDPAPWLYKVTVNVCFDLRRKRRELPLESAGEQRTPEAGVDEQMELEDQRKALREALQRLPEKMRAAVVLRDIEGRSTAEVAEILGSSEVTVRSQISQARLRLSKMLRRQS